MSEEERRKLHVSDEASAEGPRLADEAGKACERKVRYFIDNIAHAGRTAECGDYRVGIAIEKAEPLWYPCGDELALREPPKGANRHLEVIVTDRADGRFLPGLDVNVELVAEDGDKTNGKRYVESVVVQSDDLALETAREPA